MNSTLDHRIIDRGLLALAVYNADPDRELLPTAAYIYGSLLRPLAYHCYASGAPQGYTAPVNTRFCLVHCQGRAIHAYLPHTWVLTDKPLPELHVQHFALVDVFNGGFNKPDRNPRYPLLNLFTRGHLTTLAGEMVRVVVQDNAARATQDIPTLKGRIAVALGVGSMNEWEALRRSVEQIGKTEDTALYVDVMGKTDSFGNTPLDELARWSDDRMLTLRIVEAMRQDDADGNSHQSD